jgi:hypothetical protein
VLLSPALVPLSPSVSALHSGAGVLVCSSTGHEMTSRPQGRSLSSRRQFLFCTEMYFLFFACFQLINIFPFPLFFSSSEEQRTFFFFWGRNSKKKERKGESSWADAFRAWANSGGPS